MLIVCFFDVEKGPALVAKVFVCMELYAGANTLTLKSCDSRYTCRAQSALRN